jgi:hypothetical protein
MASLFTGLLGNQGGVGAAAYADSLSAGVYVLSGKSITDTRSRVDTLAAGAYVVSGQQITDAKVGAAVNYADALSGGSYLITGNALTDVKTGAITYSDALSSGAYSLTGQSLTDELVTSVKGAGSYDDEKKKRYIVKIGEQVIVCSSKRDALALIDKQYQDNDIIKQEIEQPAVIEQVAVAEKQSKIYDIDAMLAAMQHQAQAERLAAEMQYQRLIAHYEQFIDDEEVELLLMAM